MTKSRPDSGQPLFQIFLIYVLLAAKCTFTGYGAAKFHRKTLDYEDCKAIVISTWVLSPPERSELILSRLALRRFYF